MSTVDTQVNNRRIAKNTLFLYFRTFFTMIVALYTSRVVLTALGVEDFGIWGVVGGLVSMFGFINSSLSASVFRFLAHAIGAGDKEEINKNYNASIVIHVVLALLVFLVCVSVGRWFLAEKLVVPDAKREMVNVVFYVIVATSCISLLTVPFTSVIIAYERMGVYAYLAIIDALVKLLIAYVVSVVTGERLVWYALMMLSTGVLMLGFYYVYVRMQFPFLHLCRVRDGKLYRSLMSFSGWSLFGNVAYVGYTQGLNMLINMFFGPVVNAARAISLQIEQTVRTFVTNFQTAVNPQIIKNYAAGDYRQMHQLMMHSSKLSLFLLFVIALPIMLEADTVLQLWLGQAPAHTVAFVRIMFLVIALETVSNPIGTGVVATGDIKRYHVFVGTLLLTIVPLSYAVLRMGYAVESVFYVYLFVEVLAVLMRLLVARVQIHVSVRQFLVSVLGRGTCVIVVGSILPLFLHVSMPASPLRFFAVAALGALTSVLSVAYLGLTSQERAAVMAMIRKRF